MWHCSRCCWHADWPLGMYTTRNARRRRGRRRQRTASSADGDVHRGRRADPTAGCCTPGGRVKLAPGAGRVGCAVLRHGLGITGEGGAGRQPGDGGEVFALQRHRGTPCLLRPAGVELHRADGRLFGGLRRPGLLQPPRWRRRWGCAAEPGSRSSPRPPRQGSNPKTRARSSQSVAGAPSVRW